MSEKSFAIDLAGRGERLNDRVIIFIFVFQDVISPLNYAKPVPVMRQSARSKDLTFAAIFTIHGVNIEWTSLS